MKYLILLLFSILFADSYKVIHYCLSPHILAIREFDGKYLIVDTSTLKTSIIPYTASRAECDRTARYFKLLDKIINSSKHPVLTVDFCPSHKKGFDKKIFTALESKFSTDIPVTLFMTKRWIEKHKKAFEWLKNNRHLKITWGNHTATHPYRKSLPIKKNFIFIKGYNLIKDTLKNEKYLIAQHITPSVFFRFPGLIYDKKALKEINSLGLIAIGSNAWLAKGEKITRHSIILIHGNKNEERGVRIFLKELKKIKKLYPLTDVL